MAKEGDSEYYPDPTVPFYPDKYGIEFQSVFEDLEESIKRHYLRAKMTTSIPGLLHAVRPKDVLIWALEKGRIPSRLLTLTGFRQIDDETNWPRSKRAIINKIVFQCIYNEHPHLISQRDFLNHPWIGKYGEKSYYQNGELKALKKQLKEALGFKADRGKNESKAKLSLKQIEEIMRVDNDCVQYSLRAFQTFISIVCRVKKDLLETSPHKIREITPEAFMESVYHYKIVVPYLEQAPSILLEEVRRICLLYVPEILIRYLS